MPEDTAQTIAEFRVPRGTIRASITRYRRRDRVDVRLWIAGDDGELMPTKQGISVHVEQFWELRQAIDAVAKILGPAGAQSSDAA